ncbi:M23 family metallopeptidase [Chloroflexota bacterium]
MKKFSQVFYQICGFVALIFLGIGLVLLLQWAANNPFANLASISSQSAYPPPDDANATSPYPPPDGTDTSLPYPLPEDAPPKTATPPRYNFIGPECLVDNAKGITLQLKPGWYGYIPKSTTGAGPVTILNFDRDDLELSHGKPTNLPQDHIKVEIYKFELTADKTFEQWIADKTGPENQVQPHQLAGHNGFTYIQSDNTGWTARIISLQVDLENILHVSISPTDSQALSEALEMLNTIDTTGTNTCSNMLISANEQSILLHQPIIEPSMSPDFECPSGPGNSFPGDEAHSSTIILNMPFMIGQAWIVGGDGSFYGNYHHCNYYNNYYATDWNRPDNIDEGWPIATVASGTVSSVVFPDCDAGGNYGCFVTIDHDGGYRTRYAHMLDVYVSIYEQVETGNILGTVGSTGASADPHLHLSFWRYDYDFINHLHGYYSACYNDGQTCPNGEAPFAPQGYRPSCMETTLGCTYLIDGGQFTSVNGWIVYLPLIIKE